jgi:hypothetical protein
MGNIDDEQCTDGAERAGSHRPSTSHVGSSQSNREERFLAVAFSNWRIDSARSMLVRSVFRAIGVVSGREDVHPLMQAIAEVPLVVVRHDHGAWHVVDGCAVALQHGVRSGMGLVQAESCCPPSAQSMLVEAWIRGGRTDESGRPKAFENAAGIPDALSSSSSSSSPSSSSFFRVPRCDDRLRSAVAPAGDRLLALMEDPERSKRGLIRLGRCLERWIPDISIDLADGEFDPSDSLRSARGASVHLDGCGSPAIVGSLAGCSVLFRRMHGSEATLMRRIQASFASRGFATSLATASTVGTALAVSRCARDAAGGAREHGPHAASHSTSHSTAHPAVHPVPTGHEREALAPLTVGCLRISREAIGALASVEVRTVGQLLRLRRAGVAERFGLDGTVVRKTRPRRGGSRQAATRASDSTRTTEAVFARIAGIDVVLRRLDQALGFQPETRHLIREQEAIRLERCFDGPVHDLDALRLACAGLIDEAVTRLDARQEALRAGRFEFLHAELAPRELRLARSAPVRPLPAPSVFTPSSSTPSSSTPSISISPTIGDAADDASIPAQDRERHRVQTDDHAMSDPVSIIEVRPAHPTRERLRLWKVVHPRLERVPLDHPVDAVRLHIDDSVRLRGVQRMGLFGVAPAYEPKPLVPRTSHAGRRSGIDVDAVERLACWAEEVSARMGPDAVLHACIPHTMSEVHEAAFGSMHSDVGSRRGRMNETGWRVWHPSICASKDGARRSEPRSSESRSSAPRSSELQDRSGSIGADRWPPGFIDCPSQRLVPAMRAVLVGGAHADAMAHALACRIVWRLTVGRMEECVGARSSKNVEFEQAELGPRGGHEETVHQSGYANAHHGVLHGGRNGASTGFGVLPCPWPTLAWNGSTWFVDAIDGWERVSPPWWNAPEFWDSFFAAPVAAEQGAAGARSAPTGFAGTDGAGARPSTVLSRIRLVRMFDANPVLPDGDGASFLAAERLWIRARWPPALRRRDEGHASIGSMAAAPAARAWDMQPSSRAPSPRMMTDASEWCRKASEVLRVGVDLLVDGVWT